MLKPALQFLNGWRQDEHADKVVARLLPQLLSSLPINIKQNIAAGLQRFDHRTTRRSVTVAEYFRPFQQLAFFDHGIEAGAIDKMVIAAADLARPFRSGGDRDRKIDA